MLIFFFMVILMYCYCIMNISIYTQSSSFLLRDTSDNNELNGKPLDMNAN